MPIYKVQLPNGKTIGVQQDSPPDEAQYKQLVADIANEQQPAQTEPSTDPGFVGDLKAFGLGAVRGAPESTAFLLGMGAGGAAGANATKGPIGGVVGGLIGGTSAAIVAGQAQHGLEGLLPKSTVDAMDAYQREHPKSSAIGRILTSGFKPAAIEKSIGEFLSKRAAPAALGAVQQATLDAYGNKDKPGLFPEGELGRVLPAAAIGGLLNSETGVGRRISGIGASRAGDVIAGLRPANPNVSPEADAINRGIQASRIANQNIVSNSLNASTKGTLDEANLQANQIATGQPGAIGSPEMPVDFPSPVFQGDALSGIHNMPDVANVQTPIDQLVSKNKIDIENQVGRSGGAEGNPPGSLAGFRPNEAAVGRDTVDLQDSPDFTAPDPEFQKAIADKGDKIVDAVVKSADETELRKNLAPLGLNARAKARALDELLQAKEAADKAESDNTKDENQAPSRQTAEGGVSGAGEGGIAYNPFAGNAGKALSQIQRIVYVRHNDGSYTVDAFTDLGKKKIAGKANYGKMPVPAISLESIPYTKLQAIFGHKIAGDILVHSGTHSDTVPGVGVSGEIAVKPTDFTSQFNSGGAVNPSVLAHLSSTAAGAAIGYSQGSTPEEKRRNAILGALAGLGGSLSVHAGLTLAKKNPALLDQIKALGSDYTTKPSTKSSDAIQKQSPTSVSVDSPPGVGSEVVEGVSQPEKPSVPRKPISQAEGEEAVDYRKRLLAGIEKISDRVASSPSVDIETKKQIQSAIDSIDPASDKNGYIERVHNRALELEAEGRNAVKGRNEAQTADIEDISNELKASKAQPLNDFEKSNTLGQRVSAMTSVKNAIKDSLTGFTNGYNALDRHTSNRDTVFNAMDGFQGFRGAMNRVFGGRLDLAYVHEQNLKGTWKDPLAALAKKLDAKSMERINIYAHNRMNMANPDIPNTHLADSGVTPEVANSIKLTPEEQAFYDAARKVLDSQSGPTVRQAMHQDFNVDVGQVKDYWPTQVIGKRPIKAFGRQAVEGESGYEAALDDQLKALRQDFTGINTTKTNQGQTIEKVEGAGGKINLSENVIERHLQQAAHLVAYGKELQTLGKVARQKWFGQKYGDNGQRYVMDLLDSVARDSAPAKSTSIPAVDAITRNYAVAILALRVFSQLKHVSNIAYGVNEVGASSLAKGMIDGNTTAGRAWLKKNAPEAFQRAGGETAIHELLQGNKFRKIQAGTFAVERAADRQIAAAATLGAYKNELERMGLPTENYLTDPVNKEAQKHAMIVARKVVTSSLKKDAPQAISRGKLTGGDMTLSRAALQFQQTALRQIHYMKTEIISEGVGKGDLGHAAKATAAILSALAIETAMVEASKKTMGAKAKKGDEASFISEMALEGSRKVPGVSQLMAATGHGDTGVPVQDLTVKGLFDIGQVLKGKNQYGTPLRGKSLQKTKADALGFVGSLAGVPGAQTAAQVYKNRVIK